MAKTRAPSQRQLRVGELIRHALMDVIGRTNFRDPVLASSSVTVTEVSMSPDLRHAIAFVTPFGMDNPEGLVAALNRAAPYLRHQIAGDLRLRLLPEIRFSEDKAHAYASRIDELLRRPEVARDIAAPADSTAERPRRPRKTRSRES